MYKPVISGEAWSRAAAILLLVFSSACVYIEGNGKFGEEQRLVSNFEVIEVSGDMDVVAHVTRKADIHSVEVHLEGDSNLLAHINTEVHGGALCIDSDENLEPTMPLVIKVAVPSLHGVEISGSSAIEVSNISVERFFVESSGSSSLRLDGQTGKLEIDISGSSDVRARNLSAQRAEIEVSGSSEISLCASEHVEVDISGSSDVDVYCDPASIEKDISGSARVKRRE